VISSAKGQIYNYIYIFVSTQDPTGAYFHPTAWILTYNCAGLLVT